MLADSLVYNESVVRVMVIMTFLASKKTGELPCNVSIFEGHWNA